MDLATLKAQIKANSLNDYYIFTGPEIEVMSQYLKQMAKVTNSTVKNLDSITDLAKFSHSRAMLKNSFIYVLRESKEFIQDEQLRAKITQKNAFSDAVVVFVYNTIDKRSKVYKNYQDNIVEFEPLRKDILVKYIQRVLPLSDRNSEILVDVCESDYSRILLEIDKIQRFCRAVNSTDWDNCFRKLLDDGTIYIPPRDAVFDFVDAVLRAKQRKAFSLLRESYMCGEATLVLLSNLYNSAKQVLQVQSYDGQAKITEATGLTPFQVKLASGRKRVYSNQDLIYLMRLVRSAEKGIKTGEIEDAVAVTYVLANFW